MSGSRGDSAIIFLRVSTGKQDEAPQLPTCEAHCHERGYKVDPAHILIARGKSAYKGEHEPYWQEVVKEIREGRAQVVVLWMVDRFDRQDIRHAVPMANAVLDIGGRIEFADPEQSDIDMSTSDGFKRFTDYVYYAHKESVIKGKRTKIHHTARIKANALTGRPPYGYRVIVKPGYEDKPKWQQYKYLEQDPATGPIVIKMVDWYLDDSLSRRAIAKRLDSIGAPTPNRNGDNHRHGEGWTVKTVSDILHSESLIGIRRDRNGKIIMKFEEIALIDRAKFYRLQAAIKSNTKRRGNTMKPKGMLDKVAYCRKCGRRLYYRKDPPRGSYSWYGLRCMGTSKNPSKCKVMVGAKAVESRVDAMFTGDGVFAGKHIIETGSYNPSADYQRQIDDLEYTLRHELDPVDDPEYLTKRAEIITKIQDLRTAKDEAKTEPRPRDTGIVVSDRWMKMDKQQKRAFLLRTDFKVYVSIWHSYGDSGFEADLDDLDPRLVERFGKPKRRVMVEQAGNPYKILGELEHLAV